MHYSHLVFHFSAPWCLGRVSELTPSTSRQKAISDASKSTSFSSAYSSGREATYASLMMPTPPRKLRIFSKLKQVGQPPLEVVEETASEQVNLHHKTNDANGQLLTTSKQISQAENCKQNLKLQGFNQQGLDYDSEFVLYLFHSSDLSYCNFWSKSDICKLDAFDSTPKTWNGS